MEKAMETKGASERKRWNMSELMLCWTPGINHRIPLEDMRLGKDSALKQLSKGSC